ncbi:MAG: DUF3558 domain-containing protein, partial [Actinomycetota bacterium]|nr:DUF3558 domain-containing protein [Actinomycetota bacterium]
MTRPAALLVGAAVLALLPGCARPDGPAATSSGSTRAPVSAPPIDPPDPAAVAEARLDRCP